MVEEKVVITLEKISNVIKGLLWNVAKEEKVSPLQIQFLLYISSRGPKGVGVGDIAREFGLTDATASDSITTLMDKGFVIKERDQNDSRKVYVKLTKDGKELVKRARRWKEPIKSLLKEMKDEDKGKLLFLLMEVIKSLQDKGLIEEARVCLACEHFTERDKDGEKIYYCTLTESELPLFALKVDCASFERKIR